MIAYLDSSVILRLVLSEPNPLPEWSEIRAGVTSSLAEVEILRTLDRLRFAVPAIDSQVLAERREVAFRLLEGLETIEITRVILARAAQPLPTPLGTLDAVHLVSAMGWREHAQSGFVWKHACGLFKRMDECTGGTGFEHRGKTVV